MHELSWKQEYEIGHAFIDREHKHLFDIALEAFKPVAPEKRKKKIKDTIIELNEYMKIHFKHEESFMRVIEYPHINEHMAIHQMIIENMNIMLSKLATINIKEFEKDLAFFIDSALVTHILQEDKKIQKFYQDKKGQRHIIHWKSEYLVGEDEIDKEHQQLFEIANEAFIENEQQESRKDKIKDIVVKLASYVQKHFEHEESYMQSIDYPQLKHHHELHTIIINEMNAFIKKMVQMDAATFELELAIFIEKWLVQHIIHEDKDIKKFLDQEQIDIINLEDV